MGKILTTSSSQNRLLPNTPAGAQPWASRYFLCMVFPTPNPLFPGHSGTCLPLPGRTLQAGSAPHSLYPFACSRPGPRCPHSICSSRTGRTGPSVARVARVPGSVGTPMEWPVIRLPERPGTGLPGETQHLQTAGTDVQASPGRLRAAAETRRAEADVSQRLSQFVYWSSA